MRERREKDRERVRKRDYLFLKGTKGALAPFSCLVLIYALTKGLKIVKYTLLI